MMQENLPENREREQIMLAILEMLVKKGLLSREEKENIFGESGNL